MGLDLSTLEQRVLFARKELGRWQFGAPEFDLAVRLLADVVVELVAREIARELENR